MIAETPSLRRRLLQVDGHTKRALDVGRTRLLVTGLVFACAFAVIGLRVLHVAVLGSDGPAPLARSEVARPHLAQRADIVDRAGRVLATTLPTPSLYANPREIRDPERAAQRIVRVLPDLSQGRVAARLGMDRGFVWLKRDLGPRQQVAVNNLGIPGLYFRQEERRFYPQGDLTAHVIGFTDIDNRGLAGIERSFDKLLRDRHSPLRLSLDLRVQHVLVDELSRAMAGFDGTGAAGVIMDATTGELVALASLPAFDPNSPGAASQEARFNRAALGVYEMGSVFKIFTVASVLDSGAVKLHDRFDVSEPIRIGGYAIRDFKPKDGKLTVPEIFMHSSNIGTVRMALAGGSALQRRTLRRLGLTSPTHVELPEVGRPMVPSPWREINTMTISYGHGLAITPLQLTAAVAATVNGGVLPRPTLLAQAAGRQPEGRRVFDRETSATMRQLLRLVVTYGTGGKAAVPGYRVGGKTGTADKLRGGRYDGDSRIASFVGAFPIDDPAYVVFAMIDEPQGTERSFGYATGGWVAAPAVRRIIARAGPMLGVTPQAPAQVPAEENHPLLVRVKANARAANTP